MDIDLLKACKELLTCSLPHDASGQDIIRRARAAVAKAEANAHLFAAAPDLLAACKGLEEAYAALLEYAGLGDTNPAYGHTWPPLAAARAAIAKATRQN